MHFPRAAVPGGGAGVVAYGAGGGGVPAATSLLAPPQAEASRLGDGGDDWRSSRFAFSREALGASSAGELTAMMAELQAEQVAHFMGLDRKGRPTLLLLGARVAKHLTPAKRDRLLLHLLMQAEPLASASGDQGFALLLLHADFHWDMVSYPYP